TAPACITPPTISTTRRSCTAPRSGSRWWRTRWRREVSRRVESPNRQWWSRRGPGEGRDHTADSIRSARCWLPSQNGSLGLWVLAFARTTRVRRSNPQTTYSVIERSNATRQSRATHTTLDCHVAEPVIGPRFARTRWLLAMTVE